MTKIILREDINPVDGKLIGYVYVETDTLNSAKAEATSKGKTLKDHLKDNGWTDADIAKVEAEYHD